MSENIYEFLVDGASNTEDTDDESIVGEVIPDAVSDAVSDIVTTDNDLDNDADNDADNDLDDINDADNDTPIMTLEHPVLGDVISPESLVKINKLDFEKEMREIVIMRPERRRTKNVLSKFEMTEIVSIRATQIAQYNNAFVDITGLDDPILMAKRELMMRRCPLVLRRHIGDVVANNIITSYYEDWLPNEMGFSTTYSEAM